VCETESLCSEISLFYLTIWRLRLDVKSSLYHWSSRVGNQRRRLFHSKAALALFRDLFLKKALLLRGGLTSFPVRESRRGGRFFLLGFCRVGVRVRRAGHLDARPDAGALHGIGGANGVGDAVRGCFYGSENRHGVLCENGENVLDRI
jgi:hypothetical protein